jgi:copper homeostasis protein (lipoprotein)
MVYLERSDEPLYEIGSWLLSADRRTLTLLGGRGTPQQFRIVDASTLRKLDIEGREIDSKLDYSLARMPALETIEPRLAMRGMYRYFADAGLFTECSTRQRWPVAQQADNATLERGYLKVRREPGDEVLVSVDGEVKQLPRMEGAGTIPTLVVHKFTGAWPGETCGARFATAELLNTYWKLTALDGQPVTVAGRQREPHLVLHAKDQRVAGFSGCNRIAGGFTLKGNELSFDRMAGTMRACVDGMEGELAFLNALGRVARWNVSGEHLELSDAGGKVVARFEARALR